MRPRTEHVPKPVLHAVDAMTDGDNELLLSL
jgi:hypothetical protein